MKVKDDYRCYSFPDGKAPQKKKKIKLKSRSVFKEDQDEMALLLLSDKELHPGGRLLKKDKKKKKKINENPSKESSSGCVWQ